MKNINYLCSCYKYNNMKVLNGENIGSTSKDLVLNTYSKIYIRYGNRFIEIDPIKLEKLLKSVE